MFKVEYIDLGFEAVIKALTSNASRAVEVGLFDEHAELVLPAIVNEFGSTKQNIPERPAWRSVVQEKQDDWVKTVEDGVAKVLEGKDASYAQVYRRVGQQMRDDLKESITRWSEPAKEDTTLEDGARRGESSNPLIATGRTVASIQFRIVDPRESEGES